jgi:flagellar basal body rod protein FlgG
MPLPMNIGIYQSASALSALERWQDSVSQNIASSQTTAYRKRTVNFSTTKAGEIQLDPHARPGSDTGTALIFPQVNTGINFTAGETQATRRDLDVALQGEGFFEVQLPDGSHAFTRNGQFHLRADRTLVNGAGYEVLTDGGAPVTLVPNGSPLTINPDGTLVQGDISLGKLSVQKFTDPSQLTPVAGGLFLAAPGVRSQPVDSPEVLQGYLEASNVTPLREMVDLVLISRAYEANQKIINTVDQQMQKTLDALG